MMALMGSSGAGKSSLLNALAGRLPSDRVSGDVLVNNVPAKSKVMKQISAYVLQDDRLLPLLTVKETLRYAALFRLPAALSINQKFRRVDEVIDKLGLTKVRGARIQSLSGGERRRTSIGVELVTEPGLLFLDEPTSGLDSKTALSLIENLKELCERFGHTMICTIHQPRSRIFNLFDTLLVMAEGHVVYFGPTGRSVLYYRAKGFECPTHENPADYFIDLTTFDPHRKEESQARTRQLIETYDEPEIKSLATTGWEETESRRLPSAFSNFVWLFDRSLKAVRRNIPFIATRTVQTLVVAIVVAALFFQLDDDQTGATDRTGLLVLTIINNSFNEVLATLLIFAPESDVVQREIASGTYTALPYFLAKLLADLPVQVVFPAVWAIIAYWAAGLQADVLKFLTHLSVIIAAAFVANSIGIVICVSAAIDKASALAPLSIIVNVIFSGFFVTAESIPGPFRWLTWLSFIRYAWSALMNEEFNGLDLHCTSDQELRSTQGNTTVTQCPYTKGEQVLEARDVVDIDSWIVVLLLYGVAFMLRVIAFFIFWRRKRAG